MFIFVGAAVNIYRAANQAPSGIGREVQATEVLVVKVDAGPKPKIVAGWRRSCRCLRDLAGAGLELSDCGDRDHESRARATPVEE